jgi:uncharacterized protein
MTLMETGAYALPAGMDSWQPFVREDGTVSGEVQWLRASAAGESPALYTGLWRHQPDEEPEGAPYAVSGSETFLLIDGAIELVLPDGTSMRIDKGDIVSFPDGFTATWFTLEPVLKFFVVAR